MNASRKPKNEYRQLKNKRLDVLLIFPIWVTANGRGRLQRMLPPLGILSMASHLKAAGYEVHIMDMHAEEMTPEEFRAEIRRLQPRFLGITVLSNHFVQAHNISYITKQEVSDCKICVGGVHAEAYPEQMLQNRCIDFVGRGDGEDLMLELVQGQSPEKIPGLCFRKGNEIIFNPPRPTEMDLDKFPVPAYELIDFDNYFPAVGTYRRLPAMNVLMTRGCPGKCTFCNSAKTVLRRRSPRKMVDLIKMLHDTYGIRQITFYDDTFTAHKKNLIQFCEIMIAENVDVDWVCYARGDMFTDEMAQLLSRAGCHHILLGIESGSESLMKEIGKPINKGQYKKVVEIAHKYKIEVRGAFIIGHLNETHSTLKESLDFAIDLDLDFYQPSVLTPYPGTALYIQSKKEGRLAHEHFERYGQGEVILKMNHLDEKDIYQFLKWSFYRFYFRPKVIWRFAKRLKQWQQFLDIAKAFFIIIIEDFKIKSSSELNAWLDFDVKEIADSQIKVPEVDRLTFQVKQEAFYNQKNPGPTQASAH